MQAAREVHVRKVLVEVLAESQILQAAREAHNRKQLTIFKNNWTPLTNMKNKENLKTTENLWPTWKMGNPEKQLENLWKHWNQPLATEVSRETADQSLKQRDNMEIFWNQPKTADQFLKWLKTFETHEKSQNSWPISKTTENHWNTMEKQKQLTNF